MLKVVASRNLKHRKQFSEVNNGYSIFDRKAEIDVQLFIPSNIWLSKLLVCYCYLRMRCTAIFRAHNRQHQSLLLELPV